MSEKKDPMREIRLQLTAPKSIKNVDFQQNMAGWNVSACLKERYLQSGLKHLNSITDNDIKLLQQETLKQNVGFVSFDCVDRMKNPLLICDGRQKSWFLPC